MSINEDIKSLSDLELKNLSVLIKQEIINRKSPNKKLISKLILKKILSDGFFGTPFLYISIILKECCIPKTLAEKETLEQTLHNILKNEIELFLNNISIEDLKNFKIKNLTINYLDLQKYLLFLWNGGFAFDNGILMLNRIKENENLTQEDIAIINKNINKYSKFKSAEMFLTSFLNDIKENAFIELSYLNYYYKNTLKWK